MTRARTVNEIPSGGGVDGKPDSVHPGGLDACRWLLAGGALSPFAIAGRATRRHVKEIPHVYRRSSPRLR